MSRTSRRSGKAVLAFVVFGLFAAGALWARFSHGSSDASEYDVAVLTDGPVAYWAMNGAETEPDLVGNSHSGTYVGGRPSTAIMPNGDRAVDFNGSDQYMTVPSSPKFSIATSGQLTWEAWIRPDALQFPSSNEGYVDWIGKCQGYAPTCEWGARIYNATNAQDRPSRLSAYAFNPDAGKGSGAVWQPDRTMTLLDQWVHVVGQYQTVRQPAGCGGQQVGGIDIWVNGVPWNQSFHLPTGCMSQYGTDPQAGSSPLNVGSMALDTFFEGAIGKVAIYDNPLSPSQIATHFAAMVGAQPTGACTDTCHASMPDNR